MPVILFEPPRNRTEKVIIPLIAIVVAVLPFVFSGLVAALVKQPTNQVQAISRW